MYWDKSFNNFSMSTDAAWVGLYRDPDWSNDTNVFFRWADGSDFEGHNLKPHLSSGKSCCYFTHGGPFQSSRNADIINDYCFKRLQFLCHFEGGYPRNPDVPCYATTTDGNGIQLQYSD
ncbi:unnamed protein product [Cyprideis torosa]|uniref:Uncharacterized protein n=1 Tax=Cyprideis torosa TaxID=163714 RepID=A0A7R8WQM1_9CRUS|nr:unnamed protein product [Cyprideis torosa]CAG0906190.1 unnamed protein product [Cyprideis torosa]